MNDVRYILGHSEREICRLIDQAALLQPTTERLLRSAGIQQGMRVLDLGCGAGDVALLAADLVGSSGSVVGIDRNPQVIAVARERARLARVRHVVFTSAALDRLVDSTPFDLVVGRYVLIHQADPVPFLQQAARFARPGGTLALHEIIIDRPMACRPDVALWKQTTEVLLAAVRSGFAGWDVGSRLVEVFSDAGLPEPALFSGTLVGGGVDTPLYAWLAETTQSVLPQIIQSGLATAETIDTLEQRLRIAVAEARAQVEISPQICAWTRV